MHDGLMNVQIGGELTIYSANGLFNEHVKNTSWADKVQIDLSNVQEIDTSGIQILLMIRKQVLSKEGELCFSKLSEPVQKYLDLFQLNEPFGIAT